MMKTSYRFGEVVRLDRQVESATDKVQFKDVWGTDHGGVSLLAFSAGQSLPEHLAPAQVMVYVLEGMIEFSMLGTPSQLQAGDIILMGQGVPHSVTAKTDSKIMLVKIKA